MGGCSVMVCERLMASDALGGVRCVLSMDDDALVNRDWVDWVLSCPPAGGTAFLGRTLGVGGGGGNADSCASRGE